MATVQERIHEVVEQFIDGGETISKRERLEEMLAEAFGGPDSFLYEGWKCQRIPNQDIPKFRGHHDLDYYGYQCTHIATTKVIWLAGSGQDMSADYTRRQIDFWNEWLNKFGNLEGVRE